ncbi:cardiolipin synthase [Bacillus sp. EB106-08-02-XG196]|jgi:cardiolipin synthase A/B|uniref:cardiolipin synthase n=1 Tax=Bacillus sp. EB106-08-02-XG196 TaxID=2737049 RepID=UPI0015C4E1CC|nr:cardiolipin synthase [Bacillus sp. EB106-08-02-XG196]NWQ40938.1 cardiolipin synthase [Bacillus sp. EB106-08-02-XG196]
MNLPSIVIALILLIIVWLYLDLTFGRKKHISLFQKRETPILYGNFDIFPHGKELFADYFHELKMARSHIHILFYIVRDDQFSQQFFEILKAKAKEGIEVRLLVDRIGSHKVKKPAINDLRAAGVEFAFSNRIRLPFLFYSSQVRNHRKISIIDGKIGYLGGFNVGKEYIDEDPKLSPWRDYHLKITGESIPFLQQEFFIDWNEYSSENVAVEAYTPKQPKGKIAHQFVPTEAGFLEKKYLPFLQSAKKSIVIGTPYFIPSNKLINELITAAKRGIMITIVVPYITDHMLVQEASYRYLRSMLKAGAQVFQYRNGFYHAKSIIIDDQLCDIGTANFDKRSLFLNKEINCYFYDAAFVDRFKEVIHKDILDSKPLKLEDLNKPNLFRSLKEGVAGALSFFL